MDVSVGRLYPGSRTGSDEKWESRPAGLWIKRSTKRGSSDSDTAVTDVDVLFGDDAAEARDGWSVTGTQLLLGTGDSLTNVHVSVRRGPPQEPRKPVPRVPDNGRFKIMQIADLHLSTGVGACRDAIPEGFNDGPCEADPRTLEFVSKMLDEEKPDFVVLSGDQVNGQTAPDAPTVSASPPLPSPPPSPSLVGASGSRPLRLCPAADAELQAILKIASLLIKRQIPFASIFGNHDDEGSMSRRDQMIIYESLPYSLATSGPVEVDGVGNYYIEVLARGKSDHSALTLYFLDTHSYSPDERRYPGYDWIKPSQIDWFKRTASGLKAKHQEYTHRHMDLAFIHIPLPEYVDWDLPRVGSWLEGVTAPSFNTGFRDALVEAGVVMVSAGHDHCNDYCSLSLEAAGSAGGKSSKPKAVKESQREPRAGKDTEGGAAGAATKEAHEEELTPALWMCYGGGVGFGGYGGYEGYVRRLRVFEVDVNEARITTWKRLEAGKTSARVDEQIIVDGGKPVPPFPAH